MADNQFYQSSYVPTVQFKTGGGRKAALVPDWLSASYIDLADKITKFTFYTIREEDLCQPDGIAHKAYGDSNWWWVICDYNGIINPFTDMIVGARIRVPDLLEVNQLLQAKPNKNVVDKRGTIITI